TPTAALASSQTLSASRPATAATPWRPTPLCHHKGVGRCMLTRDYDCSVRLERCRARKRGSTHSAHLVDRGLIAQQRIRSAPEDAGLRVQRAGHVERIEPRVGRRPVDGSHRIVGQCAVDAGGGGAQRATSIEVEAVFFGYQTLLKLVDRERVAERVLRGAMD